LFREARSCCKEVRDQNDPGNPAFSLLVSFSISNTTCMHAALHCFKGSSSPFCMLWLNSWQVAKRTGVAPQVAKRTGLRTSVPAPSQEAATAPIRLKFNVGKSVSANPTTTRLRQTSMASHAQKIEGKGVSSPYWASDKRAGGDNGDTDKPEGRSLRSRANGMQ
jgi:hypothetical protein